MVSKRLSLANGLGSYAAALLADGITEDIELLQCVDKLDRATPGSNSAWALCEKIRAGKAGRTEAREALKRAMEPKTEPAAQPKRESTADAKNHELQPSHAFRYWLQHDHPWISRDYMEILTHTLTDCDREPLMRQLEIIEEMQQNLERRRIALHDSLKTICKQVANNTGDLAQHVAFEKYYREKKEQQQ